MADETDSPRTEHATPRRLEQARDEGQVARSRELSTSLILFASGLMFYAVGPRIIDGFALMLRRGLSLSSAEAFDTGGMLARLASMATDGIFAVAPLLAVLLVVAVLTPTLVGGWIFSAQAVQPDFSRLSPMRGLKMILSWHGFGELVKSAGKASLVGIAALGVFHSTHGDFMGLVATPTDHGLAAFGVTLTWAFLIIASSLAVVAAADVPFQIWRYGKSLSMTRDEVRKEMRETEGDPQVKARIRKEQRDRARARMMQEVPKADVVVINPLHYAVALSYRESNMRAPTVVAKGAELIAARIRDLATEHGIPILQAPPLARALYFHTEIGQEIPAPLYNAVAQVLAYVYQLRVWRTGSVRGARAPVEPTDLPVPSEMDSKRGKR